MLYKFIGGSANGQMIDVAQHPPPRSFKVAMPSALFSPLESNKSVDCSVQEYTLVELRDGKGGCWAEYHLIPPPPPFPPVKVVRGEKHIGYETLDGEFIPVSPTSNKVPTQWAVPFVLFASIFLFGVAIGYFVL